MSKSAFNWFGPWDGNYLCRFHRWEYHEGNLFRHYQCVRCGEFCMPMKPCSRPASKRSRVR